MLLTTNWLSAFVTLFVTIGPIEAAVIFAGLTSGVHRPDRRALAARAVLIAGAVLLLFALCGGVLLALLHVSLPAFRVAGGVLLFLQAVSLTFANAGLSSISDEEQREARRPGDIAVFPLAFPLIAGPGSLLAVVLLMGRSSGLIQSVAILLMLAVCLAITYGAMRASDVLLQRLGETGTDVIGRVSGVLLAALAVQFIFDGLRQAGLFG